MITQDQINRVHALGEKWGIIDPIKQFIKMGEELGEYLEAKDNLSIRKRGEMKAEMGDMWFTLILLCKQKGVDFESIYTEEATQQIETFQFDDNNKFLYLASVIHFELGGNLLKDRVKVSHVRDLIRFWLSECATKFIDPAEALETVLIKNETKAGKTVKKKK